MYSSAAESEMARHWPEVAPLDAVRSKMNWIGESTQATSGRSVTCRSSTRWTLTIGEVPRRSAASGSPNAPRAADTRGGVATTTASTTILRPAEVTVNEPPGDRSIELTGEPSTVSTPAAASARAAFWP